MSELFLSLVREIVAPYLKTRQFVRRGHKFYRDLGELIWLIDFQRSTSNSKELTRFTINLGVLSRTVADAYGKKDIKLNFIEDDCNIKKRIGYLMEERSDVWFTIDENTSFENLGSLILDLLKDAAIPFLSEFKDEAALYEFWAGGNYCGNTELGRLHKVLILAAKFGDQTRIDETVEALKKDPEMKYGTKRLLQKLGFDRTG